MTSWQFKVTSYSPSLEFTVTVNIVFTALYVGSRLVGNNGLTWYVLTCSCTYLCYTFKEKRTLVYNDLLIFFLAYVCGSIFLFQPKSIDPLTLQCLFVLKHAKNIWSDIPLERPCSWHRIICIQYTWQQSSRKMHAFQMRCCQRILDISYNRGSLQKDPSSNLRIWRTVLTMV